MDEATNEELKFAQSIALFDKGEYTNAFQGFAELYNQGFAQAEIMEILTEAYYQPNENELREMYEHNVSLLEGYPYVWDKQFTDFDDLKVQLFPLNDDEFYVLDREKHEFMTIYDAKTENQMKYFFKDVKKALFIENEVNGYNLMFLFDNVRRSEDYGADNHIYFYYDNMNVLSKLLQTVDVEPLLQDEKFVFLIGEGNRKCYPINFKKQFEIDYNKMEKKPLKIEEMKHLIFYFKYAYSGTGLFSEVLAANNAVASFFGYSFHLELAQAGLMSDFEELLKYPEREIYVEQLCDYVENNREQIKIDHLNELMEFIVNYAEERRTLQVIEIFKLLFAFIFDKNPFGGNSRLVPAIFLEPHIWNVNIYNEILAMFKYQQIITSFREPITTFARSYQYGLIWNEFQAKYILGSTYHHFDFLEKKYLRNFYAIRFEDLKLKPRATLLSVCKTLNLPFEERMLKVKASATNKEGEVISGFDAKPVSRDLSNVFSDFDLVRLKMFYCAIHEFFGYEQFDFALYPLTEEEVFNLFKYPFNFEQECSKRYNIRPENLRKWIFDTMIDGYRKSLAHEVNFPHLIKPLEDADD